MVCGTGGKLKSTKAQMYHRSTGATVTCTCVQTIHVSATLLGLLLSEAESSPEYQWRQNASTNVPTTSRVTSQTLAIALYLKGPRVPHWQVALAISVPGVCPCNGSAKQITELI